jgi:hypothetical protein
MRRRADAMLAHAGVIWTTLRDASGTAHSHRSSPLTLAVAHALADALRTDCGLTSVVAEAPCCRHLATVTLGGRDVVVGAGRPMLSRADALAVGTPLAIVGEAVEPWGAEVYGHTDAELRAAPRMAGTTAGVEACGG